jgi:hypothetical protein
MGLSQLRSCEGRHAAKRSGGGKRAAFTLT